MGPACFVLFFVLAGSAAWLSTLLSAPGSACVGLLGAPEHEFLQPVLFLGLDGAGGGRGGSCLWTELLAGF